MRGSWSPAQGCVACPCPRNRHRADVGAIRRWSSGPASCRPARRPAARSPALDLVLDDRPVLVDGPLAGRRRGAGRAACLRMAVSASSASVRTSGVSEAGGGDHGGGLDDRAISRGNADGCSRPLAAGGGQGSDAEEPRWMRPRRRSSDPRRQAWSPGPGERTANTTATTTARWARAGAGCTTRIDAEGSVGGEGKERPGRRRADQDPAVCDVDGLGGEEEGDAEFQDLESPERDPPTGDCRARNLRRGAGPLRRPTAWARRVRKGCPLGPVRGRWCRALAGRERGPEPEPERLPGVPPSAHRIGSPLAPSSSPFLNSFWAEPSERASFGICVDPNTRRR